MSLTYLPNRVQGDRKQIGKKRTPGEIRIQNGMDRVLTHCSSLSRRAFQRDHIRLLALCSTSILFLSLTDVAELDGGNVAKISFPSPNDLTNFVCKVCKSPCPISTTVSLFNGRSCWPSLASAVLEYNINCVLWRSSTYRPC